MGFLSFFLQAEALLDPTVWAVVLISFTNALPTGGLGAFSNIILTAFVRRVSNFIRSYRSNFMANRASRSFKHIF